MARAFWWDGWLARQDALVPAGIVQGGNGSRTQDTSDFVMRWEAWNYDTIAEAAQRPASDGGLVIALDVSGLMLLEQLVSAAPSNVHASEDACAVGRTNTRPGGRSCGPCTALNEWSVTRRRRAAAVLLPFLKLVPTSSLR